MNRKVYLIGIMLILGPLAWGTGGCGGDNGLDPSIEISSNDFEGTYRLRNENCTGELPMEITILQYSATDFSLTITNPGGSDVLTSGDMFYGEYSSETLSFDGIRLYAGRITTDEAAANNSDQTDLDAERGDITAVTPDDSADGWCFMTYKPI